MSERHIIYGLLDPITKIIHYVGYSSNEKKRKDFTIIAITKTAPKKNVFGSRVLKNKDYNQLWK
jgi:hypothetical protein